MEFFFQYLHCESSSMSIVNGKIRCFRTTILQHDNMFILRDTLCVCCAGADDEANNSSFLAHQVGQLRSRTRTASAASEPQFRRPGGEAQRQREYPGRSRGPVRKGKRKHDAESVHEQCDARALAREIFDQGCRASPAAITTDAECQGPEKLPRR